MATILQTVETGAHTSLPTENVDPKWYAAYTSANHEKRVAEQLGVRLVEHFVPLYESMRCWKDRKVRLQLPLFPGYVFVRLTRSERGDKQRHRLIERSRDSAAFAFTRDRAGDRVDLRRAPGLDVLQHR